MSERVAAISRDEIVVSSNTTTKKSNSNSSTSRMSSNFLLLIKILKESIKIFNNNKASFLSIITFLSLPLSLLIHSLSLSSLPLHFQSLSVLSLSSVVPTRSEFRQLWRESRDLSLSLLHLKLLYFLPISFFSLLTTLTSVTLTHSACIRKPVSVLTLFASVKSAWVPPLITSIYCYVILLLYSFGVNVFSGVVLTSPRLSLVVRAVGFGFEVYVMGLLAVSMVASILEKQIGWEAVRFAWNVMEGRRVCGWAVSGSLVVVTWWILWRIDRGVMVVDAGDLSEFSVVVVLRWWERWGLVAFYGVVVVWGCIVFTVFWTACRKRHVVKGGGEHEEVELDEERAVTSIDS